MEKHNNNEYGQTDPDFIDQNTLVDGNPILSDDMYKHTASTEHTPEFGESDPDYIEQNTLVDHDNYARDEDPYQNQANYIEDLKHPGSDFEIYQNTKSENMSPDENISKNDTVKKDKNQDE